MVVNSPHWPEVKSRSSAAQFPRLPADPSRVLAEREDLLRGGGVILVFALVLAVIRSLPGPVLFPLRRWRSCYTDLFRGVPTICRFLLGFGVPALQLPASQ